MPSRQRHASLRILVQFIFDSADHRVSITDLGTGRTTVVTGDVWSAPASLSSRAASEVDVYACAINPPPGVSISLDGTRAGVQTLDSANMCCELRAAPGSHGMRFQLGAGRRWIHLELGEASELGEWMPPDLLSRPVTFGSPGRPPKPGGTDFGRVLRTLQEKVLPRMFEDHRVLGLLQAVVERSAGDPAAVRSVLAEVKGDLTAVLVRASEEGFRDLVAEG